MPKGVYKHYSHQGFQKGSQVNKGKHPSEKAIERMRIAKKGFHPVTEFKKGHTVSKKIREKLSISNKGKFSGKNHPNWKGGKTINSQGYILVYKSTHPFCNNRKCVHEQRLVVEKQIGRYLLSKETCHHINKIRDDNRPKNLIAFINHSTHLRFHHNPYNVKPEEIIFDGRKLKKEKK